MPHHLIGCFVFQPFHCRMYEWCMCMCLFNSDDFCLKQQQLWLYTHCMYDKMFFWFGLCFLLNSRYNLVNMTQPQSAYLFWTQYSFNWYIFHFRLNQTKNSNKQIFFTSLQNLNQINVIPIHSSLWLNNKKKYHKWLTTILEFKCIWNTEK